MGLFGKRDDEKKAEKDRPKADFSRVQSGSSTQPTQPVPPLGGTGTARTYTVKAGDSLSKIAKREYGDGAKWNAIFDANRDKIKNPDLIHPGQVLNIPPQP